MINFPVFGDISLDWATVWRDLGSLLPFHGPKVPRPLVFILPHTSANGPCIPFYGNILGRVFDERISKSFRHKFFADIGTLNGAAGNHPTITVASHLCARHRSGVDKQIQGTDRFGAAIPGPTFLASFWGVNSVEPDPYTIEIEGIPVHDGNIAKGGRRKGQGA